MSPTAHANPYFAHQGHPVLRHHNDGSMPSSPPDTPALQVEGVTAKDQVAAPGKEELARKLRRVASAPNAQGLFAGSPNSDQRPQTSSVGKEFVAGDSDSSNQAVAKQPDGKKLSVPVPTKPANLPVPGAIRDSVSFRRTYSSNSIKIRNVEVGPGSFDKIKLIGKGDVGKVYLVREKKSNRLYAMKGGCFVPGS